ncbi:MAG TPA: ATP-binding domain-containing protein [Trebonia sp.]|nr:ATP-binding domain-containing protein [Trebonia sp.]
MPSGTADPVVESERAYLEQSREFLRLMRENVLAMSVNPMAGDRVSLEFLKADLYRRAEALRDLPDAPLFFGRLDYDTSVDPELVGASLHVGRRHVADPEGTPVVIDWRAPVSRPFYRASSLEPMGLARRRRFGFAGGTLTAYEDESFGAAAPAPAAGPSKLLVDEIERPRSGPMRDIVATIQPEQDDIVRADAGTTVCVQGAPGTGKTAVGLHRVAYLLYAHKEQVTRRGVIVVGPNKAFLSYIRNVLPALGELDVMQTTVPELLGTVPVRGADTDAAGLVKGDARMAEVLRRALWASVAEPSGTLVVVRGSRRWRVPAHQVAELAAELRNRGVRYGAGRELLGHRIAHVILSQMEAAGETCDDRTHDAVRRTAAVRGCVDEVWPKVDPKRLLFGLLSSPEALKLAADGILSTQEQALIGWSPAPRSAGTAKWSRADLALLDEATDLIERTPSLAHVVVDEAQDLSPMEIRAVGRRCTTGAATVLGDIAQGTTPWSARTWESLLEYLGKPEGAVRELDVGYRVPRQILDFASRLLPVIAPELRPALSLRADPSSLSVAQVPGGKLGAAISAACSEAVAAPGSVAVICADAAVGDVSRALRAAGLSFGVLGSADSGAHERAAGQQEAGQEAAGQEKGDGQRLSIVPVTLAKGLEFDHVVLVEPAAIAAGEAHGLRRLYVALTRAVSRLVVLYVEPLPSALRYVP